MKTFSFRTMTNAHGPNVPQRESRNHARPARQTTQFRRPFSPNRRGGVDQAGAAVDASQRLRGLSEIQSSVENGPRLSLQRKRLRSFSGQPVQRKLTADFIQELLEDERLPALTAANRDTFEATLVSLYDTDPDVAEIFGAVGNWLLGGDASAVVLRKIVDQYKDRHSVEDATVRKALASIKGIARPAREPEAAAAAAAGAAAGAASSATVERDAPERRVAEIGTSLPVVAGLLMIFRPDESVLPDLQKDRGFRQVTQHLGEMLEGIASFGVGDVGSRGDADALLENVFAAVVGLGAEGLARGPGSPPFTYMQGLVECGFIRRLANLRLMATRGKAICHYSDASFPLIDALNSTGAVRLRYDQRHGQSQPEEADLDTELTSQSQIRAGMKAIKGLSPGK